MTRLGIPADCCDVAVLRSVLDQRIDTTLHPHAQAAVRAVGRLLDIVDRQTCAPTREREPEGPATTPAGGADHVRQETDR